MMAGKYTLAAVAAKETALFYSSQKPERDLDTGCIGHMRADFGRDGKGFWTSWEDHCPELKTQAFKDEFDDVINSLREKGILKNCAAMSEYCGNHQYAKIFAGRDNEYGFKITTDNHVYYLRCNAMSNEYNLYCYAYERGRLEKCDLLFVKPEQIVGMTDELKNKLERLAAFMIEKSATETVSGSYFMYPDDIPADIIAPELFAQHVNAFVNMLHEYDAVAETDVGSDGVIDITLYLDYCPNYEPLPEEMDDFPPDRKILDPLKSKRVPEPEKPTPEIPASKPTLTERIAKNKEKAAAQEKSAAHKSKKREELT